MRTLKIIILVFFGVHNGCKRLFSVPSASGALYIVQQPMSKCHYLGRIVILRLCCGSWVSHHRQTALVSTFSKSEHFLYIDKGNCIRWFSDGVRSGEPRYCILQLVWKQSVRRCCTHTNFIVKLKTQRDVLYENYPLIDAQVSCMTSSFCCLPTNILYEYLYLPYACYISNQFHPL